MIGIGRSFLVSRDFSARANESILIREGKSLWWMPHQLRQKMLLAFCRSLFLFDFGRALEEALVNQDSLEKEKRKRIEILRQLMILEQMEFTEKTVGTRTKPHAFAFGIWVLTVY